MADLLLKRSSQLPLGVGIVDIDTGVVGGRGGDPVSVCVQYLNEGFAVLGESVRCTEVGVFEADVLRELFEEEFLCEIDGFIGEPTLRRQLFVDVVVERCRHSLLRTTSLTRSHA